MLGVGCFFMVFGVKFCQLFEMLGGDDSKVQEPALSALLDRMWLHKFLVEATEATGMTIGVVITLARWAKFR